MSTDTTPPAAATVIYCEALTDEQAIAELGPTECGTGCGRLLSASEPWVVHGRRVEHVDCHERET